MDRGAWWAAVHGVTKSWTRLSDLPFTFHFHALEKEMATHSNVLAWRIPGTGETGGLPSIGSHRVGHDWSDAAAAAVVAGLYVFSLSVVSDSLRPYGLQPARLLCPWILQVTVLEWVAVPSSRGSSWPRAWNPGLPHCRWILRALGILEDRGMCASHVQPSELNGLMAGGCNCVCRFWQGSCSSFKCLSCVTATCGTSKSDVL